MKKQTGVAHESIHPRPDATQSGAKYTEMWSAKAWDNQLILYVIVLKLRN